MICFLNGHRDPERHNSCGICGARRAPVSFAEYSGTAVSRFSTEFAPGERDANERDDGQAIDSTVIARVVAPVKQAEAARTAGRFLGSSCSFCPAVLDGNPSEIQSRFKAATRLSGRRSGIVCGVEYDTT